MTSTVHNGFAGAQMPVMRLRLPIDAFVATLLATVALASVLPARGLGAEVLEYATGIAIAFLFFLYGARLAPQAALQGLAQWRLHLTVLGVTFVVFPALGVLTGLLPNAVLPEGLKAGVLFLCLLPSTVQSSIAFTSIARGHVAAAVCSASASNLLGMVVTPLLVAALMPEASGSGGLSFDALRGIALQLFLPFAAGQALRPWIGGLVTRNKALLGRMDRLSILLVVYAAFSEGVREGIWHQLSPAQLAVLALLCCALLAVALGISLMLSRGLGLAREDDIVLVFCGSKKSLASGLPMASVLFASSQVGLVVLPLMLFHQIQLIVCAWLARRYAQGGEAQPLAAPAAG
ncbi:bile acid:sodium symporter family protein [Rhodovarius lipocyclicus]|uniref:bile acid:sodium symporter family protein n=1 Tax=Rhodovarius lipocyclicus TaxID=268410 RepID=UPI001F1E963C|nr:bile acid:sodium symporter family protein [Rhodovarius lipocyclicus]